MELHNVIRSARKSLANFADCFGGDIFVIAEFEHCMICKFCSLLQILFLHTLINQNMPQFCISNCHFDFILSNMNIYTYLVYHTFKKKQWKCRKNNVFIVYVHTKGPISVKVS